ncbi:hypothetical protein KY284_023280 [Solanum tuberosum]|nr:hypothetical protein KY284_023280 [Solanum tuberosum]
MPFGLSNTPLTFQATMNEVFRPYLCHFILVFFDDILVYSLNWTDHTKHLQSVLQILRQHLLVAKRAKCLFRQTSIEYLGHVISIQGLSVDPTKARPLTDLLRKYAFVWDVTTLTAFETPKDKLSFTPVLALPNFSQEFQLETDASGRGIGAVLSQIRHPVAYISQKLSTQRQGASSYHREMFAIIQAVSKWRQYLLGHKFTIYTDQQSLKNLTNQAIQTPEQQKWLSKLVGYYFQIIYRPGKLNQAGDALSRLTEAVLMAFSPLHCNLCHVFFFIFPPS